MGARYKLLGKKRHAVLDLPYNEVLDTFEKALVNTDGSLCGSVDRETGVFKIEYRVEPNKKDVYETYCMLVSLKKVDDEKTRIDYGFMFDRFLNLYTRILSLICFLVPLMAAAFFFLKFHLSSPKTLFLYIPLLLISAFGLFSFIAYKEKKEEAVKMVKEFEELLISAFND